MGQRNWWFTQFEKKSSDHLAKKSSTSVWKNIAGTKIDIEEMGFRFNDIFSQIVISGDNTQFWHDTWGGSEEKLKLLFLRLSELEKKKYFRVAERLKQGGLNWRWKSCTVVVRFSSQVGIKSSIINSFRLQLGEDCISCLLTSNGFYRVNALRRKLDYISPINNNPI